MKIVEISCQAGLLEPVAVTSGVRIDVGLLDLVKFVLGTNLRLATGEQL